MAAIPSTSADENRVALIQLYSTYLVQNAAIVVAASIGLLTDFQLYGKIPDYIVGALGGGLIGGVIETILSVLFWQAALRVIGKTRLANQFNSQDSLPGLDDFYACQARKKLEESKPGRLVSWTANNARVSPITAAVISALISGFGAYLWKYSMTYLLLYAVFLVFVVELLLMSRSVHGRSGPGPKITKNRANDTKDWILTISLEKGTIEDAYVNVDCVQLQWIVDGKEQWKGIKFHSKNKKGQLKVPETLAQDDAEIEINDRGRVLLPRRKFKEIESEASENIPSEQAQ